MDNFICSQHSSALEPVLPNNVVSNLSENNDIISTQNSHIESESSVKNHISSYIDKKTLLDKVDLYQYVKTLCPDAKIEGNDIVVLNPTRHDTKLGSFRICLYGEKKGCFNDFADSYFKGKGIIDLTMLILSMTFKEALEHIFFFATGQFYGEHIRKQFTVPVSHHKMMDHTKDIIIAFTGDTTGVLPKTLQYNKQLPTQKYIYTDSENHPMIVMSRYDSDKGKHFLAQSHTANNEWVMKLPTHNRPLYNLHAIHSHKDKPIVVVEGEKTADALQECLSDFVITTTLCGSNAVDKSDLTPLYDREVYLWADNDNAGFAYIEKIKELLQNNAKRVYVLDEMFIFKHTQGYDAYDYIKEHSVDDLQLLMKTKFNQIITVKQKHCTQKEFMKETLTPLLKDKPQIRSGDSLHFGGKTGGKLHFLYTHQAKSKQQAFNAVAIQTNTTTEYTMLILDITYSQYGKFNPNKHYLGRIGCLPTPNFIVRERKGYGLQYVYFLEQKAYGKMIHLVQEIGAKLAKLAGVCRETVEIIPKATMNKDGFMFNPLTQVVRWHHNDTFTISQLNEISSSTQAIFFSRDNTVYFNAIRKIAYRAVNYMSNLHIFLNKLSSKVQSMLGIDLYEAEEQMILKSVVKFVIKNKASFKHKKYTISQQDELLFSQLNAKEKQQQGAEYVANTKRIKRKNQLLLLCKNLKSVSITQKDIAKQLKMSSSNLSMHYKPYLTQLLKNKAQQLNTQQWLYQRNIPSLLNVPNITINKMSNHPKIDSVPIS